MNEEDMLTFMVLNGLLSVKWYTPLVHKKTTHSSKPPKKSADNRIAAYHRGEISDAELCEKLGIKEDKLFRYLVDHGVLF